MCRLLASQLSQQDRGADGLLLLVPPHPELFSPTQFQQLAEPVRNDPPPASHAAVELASRLIAVCNSLPFAPYCGRTLLGSDSPCATSASSLVSLAALSLAACISPRASLLSLSRRVHRQLGGFVLSTTNFSAVRGQPGPTAPLGWMRDALAALSPTDANRHKLMATLPMFGKHLSPHLTSPHLTSPNLHVTLYISSRHPHHTSCHPHLTSSPPLGWDFKLNAHEGDESASTPIDGEAYLSLLRTHRPPRLDWHAEAAEHVFTYVRDDWRHSVYYPSLKSLAERLGMMRGLGVGVALYELGTGLDFFWDLL